LVVNYAYDLSGLFIFQVFIKVGLGLKGIGGGLVKLSKPRGLIKNKISLKTKGGEIWKGYCYLMYVVVVFLLYISSRKLYWSKRLLVCLAMFCQICFSWRLGERFFQKELCF